MKSKTKKKITESELNNYLIKSNSDIRDTLYTSYDFYLSKKYEIKIFKILLMIKK